MPIAAAGTKSPFTLRHANDPGPNRAKCAGRLREALGSGFAKRLCMTKQLLAAIVSLMFTACAGPITPPGEELSTSSADLKAAATAPAAFTAKVSASATNPVFQTTFPLATTYDLYVAFDIPTAISGTHVAVYEFVSPDGAIYQRTDVPFSMGRAKSYRVWGAMPVAGTFIQQYGMTGGWSVRVSLDAETAPRASAAFTLQ